VYRLACQLGISGVVYNDTKGVTVELQGEEEKIDEFLIRLQSGPDKPPVAKIHSCKTVDIAVIESEDKFSIKTSDSQGTALSQVTADIATCPDCLSEMFNSKNHSLRQAQYYDVRVCDVRQMRCSIHGRNRPAFSRAACCLRRMWTEDMANRQQRKNNNNANE
jgi:hydrogenase maturation factor HypF (carbamoyltransferase family)